MTSLKAADLDHPRKKAIAAMRAHLRPAQWEENSAMVQALKADIVNHPFNRHPVVDLLNKGVFDWKTMRRMHLEYRHAIVQIFTDALLAAQMQSRQLEPRLPPAAKMAPRFLLTLNDLDEFGFRPGLDAEGYYRGNPAYAHYPLFEEVLNAYGVTHQERHAYQPSSVSAAVRNHLESSYYDYLEVVALLAAAEQQVIVFSPPLRQATAALGIPVDDGYYYVHGVSEDNTADAADDDHVDDLWLILTHGLTAEHYPRIRESCLRYSDLWAQFWSHQLNEAQVPGTPVDAQAAPSHAAFDKPRPSSAAGGPQPAP